MRRYWHQATDEELAVRNAWLETELSAALALLRVREQTPISEDFIARTDAIRRAGPDDPAWTSRYEAAH